MILIFRIIVVLFSVVFLIPTGMGCALILGTNIKTIVIGGFFASLSVFEGIMLAFHVINGSMRWMTLGWCIICGGIAVIGYQKRGKDVFVGKRLFQKVHFEEGTWMVLCCAIALCLILHTIRSACYSDWDDQTYCANAVGAWYTDKVNRYAPESGIFQEAFYDKKYVVAGWPIYSAMISVLSGVHPAIIYRTVMPVFEIAFAIYVIYLLMQSFFPENRLKALEGVCIYLFLTVVASEKCGAIIPEWWLIVNPWTGKTIAFNIMIPLLLWGLFSLEDTKNPTERCAYWRVVFFVSVACCLIAASLYMVVPILFGTWGLFYLLRTHRWKEIGNFVICTLPTLACAIFMLC